MHLTESERQAVLEIATRLAPTSERTLGVLLASMYRLVVESQTLLFRAGDENSSEYFLLDGLLRSYVVDEHGNDITLAFHMGPVVFTPSMARCIGGVSQVSCEALDRAILAALPNRSLIEQMVRHVSIQRWGDEVMRRELARRVRRELILAAMPGKQRLEEFRLEHPGLEARVPHHTIASYLGMSPVTLSRLRNARL